MTWLVTEWPSCWARNRACHVCCETCDFLIGIPMVDGQESLNASVAAGITLNAIFDRRQQS